MSMVDSGIRLTEDAYIEKEQFADYRALIEPTTPLAPDLVQAGLGYLPLTQQRWATVKLRVRECLAVRPLDYGLDQDAGESYGWNIEGE